MRLHGWSKPPRKPQRKGNHKTFYPQTDNTADSHVYGYYAAGTKCRNVSYSASIQHKQTTTEKIRKNTTVAMQSKNLTIHDFAQFSFEMGKNSVEGSVFSRLTQESHTFLSL